MLPYINTTSIIPLIMNNLIQTKNITMNSKSGYSGAGKNLEQKFTHKNLQVYICISDKNHRHICEIKNLNN